MIQHPEIEKALQFSQGYLELGMFGDALNELDQLGSSRRNQSDVLMQKLCIYVEAKKWKEGVEVGMQICTSYSHLEESFISTAFCLHELRRTEEAKNLLLSGPRSLEKIALFHYNLACYEAKLGNPDSARLKLQKAITIDKKFKKLAQEDPDLSSLQGKL